MKNVLKISAVVAIALLGLACAIVISSFGGYLMRWFVWFICGAYELFFGRGIITRWMYNHDVAVHVICSMLVFTIILSIFSSKK